MEKIKLEKNISIPTRTKQKSNELYKIFESMEIGDSFVMPVIDEKASTVRGRLYMSSRNFKIHKGISWVFITRVINNEVRIWRIS